MIQIKETKTKRNENNEAGPGVGGKSLKIAQNRLANGPRKGQWTKDSARSGRVRSGPARSFVTGYSCAKTGCLYLSRSLARPVWCIKI